MSDDRQSNRLCESWSPTVTLDLINSFMIKGEVSLNRWKDETTWEYFMRLVNHRSDYNLTWDDIANKYEELYGEKYSADHMRKLAYGFQKSIELSTEKEYENNVLVMTDIHIPFQRQDVLELIQKHAHEIDALILGGDLIDNHSISSFPKIADSNLTDEIIGTHKFLKRVRAILGDEKEIICILGNHEERWRKQIMRMQEKNLQPFLNPNILEMFVDGFTIYHKGVKHVMKPIPNLTVRDSWWVNYRGLIVSHPANFSVVKGRILELASQYFINRGEDFDCVIIGHTHKQSSGVIDRHGGKYAVESGCMCLPMDYADRSAKLNYTPQAYGYVVVNWNTDDGINPNNVKQYFLN